MVRWWFGVLLLVLPGTGSRIAWAQDAAGAASAPNTAPIRVAVQYSAPRSCPSSSAFWDAFSHRSPRLQATSATSDVAVRVDIVKSARRFVGKLQLTVEGTPSEPRTVEAASCSEVLDALALTAALSVVPEAASADVEPSGAASATPEASTTPAGTPASSSSPSEEPEGEPLPPALPPAPYEVASPPDERRDSRRQQPPDPRDPGAPPAVALGVAAVGALPLASLAALGGTLFIQLSDLPGLFPKIGLGLGYISSAPFDQAARLRYGMVLGELEGCSIPAVRSGFTFSGCIALQAGSLSARGKGIEAPESSTRPWLAPGIKLRGEYATGPVLFGLELFAHVPLLPQTYDLRATDERVMRTALIAPGAALRVAFGSQ